MIYTQFDISRIFNLDFLNYGNVLEFGFLVITAFVTHLIIKKISKENLGISLAKALIFGVIYSTISLISSSIISLTMGAGFGFKFNIYDSFLNFIPYGFSQGVLFLLHEIKSSVHT